MNKASTTNQQTIETTGTETEGTNQNSQNDQGTTTANEEDVEDEQNAALNERCATIRQLLGTNEGRNTRACYQVGVEVVAVKSDQNRYGKGSVEYIATKLGRTAALLYSYAIVVENWPDEKRFAKVAAERNPKGLPLSFTHFVELAKIADEEKREELRRAALKECWSVAKLRRAMAEPADPEPKSDVHNSAPARALPTQRLSVAIAAVEAVLQLVDGEIEPDAAVLEALARDTQRLQELVIQLNTRITAPRVHAGTAGEADVVWAS